MTPIAIHLTGIDKSFGPVQANRGADLEVALGEIHALVGENGAGKSTLMRILSGLYSPDAGRMEVNGRDVTGWSTPAAIASGVGMVHQHFMLVPTLTVAENVVLGMEPSSGLTIDMLRAVSQVESLSVRSGLMVDPAATVADLSVGEAQRVEILKALHRGAKILILDEPTAVLSPPEVQELWRVLRVLRQSGGTIILITHKLDEVIDVSDTITVMRAGRTVARLSTVDTTPREIAKAMVGRDVALALDASPAAAGTTRQRTNAGDALGADQRALRIGELHALRRQETGGEHTDRVVPLQGPHPPFAQVPLCFVDTLVHVRVDEDVELLGEREGAPDERLAAREGGVEAHCAGNERRLVGPT